jgi:hypothetical protein
MQLDHAPARDPFEQVYPTTADSSGQPKSCYGSEGWGFKSLRARASERAHAMSKTSRTPRTKWRCAHPKGPSVVLGDRNCCQRAILMPLNSSPMGLAASWRSPVLSSRRASSTVRPGRRSRMAMGPLATVFTWSLSAYLSLASSSPSLGVK